MAKQQKRRGRPPKSSGTAKDKTVLLRLDGQEKEAFSQAATLAGIPVAVWMRERLRTSARRELLESGKAVPFYQTGAEAQHG